ncbi:MAG: Dabb family protein [Saprospiraceae bacterium]
MLSFLRVFCCFALLSLLACKQNNPELQAQLIAIQAQLDQANVSLKTLKTKPRPALVHSVFFKLKPEIDEAQTKIFRTKLKSLAKIEQTKQLFVAMPADTPDKRLRKDYDVVLQMHFANLEDLATYQNHALHLQVKTEVGAMLASKPFVYDYWQK